jgi:CheY-like chemotaxis protein
MEKRMQAQIPRLLVVEDYADDERLIKRALQRMECDMDVEYVHDGEEAVERLCGSGANLPIPDLIILDWKMTRVMGAQVLKVIRNSDRCKKIVVVVFSSSDGESDVEECKLLGGNDYVVKPIDYAKFLAAVQRIVTTYLPPLG